MDTSYLYTKNITQLKLLAKQAGIKLPSGATKTKIISLLREADEKKAATREAEAPDDAALPVSSAKAEEASAKEAQAEEAPAEAPKRKRGRPPKNAEAQDAPKSAKRGKSAGNGKKDAKQTEVSESAAKTTSSSKTASPAKAAAGKRVKKAASEKPAGEANDAKSAPETEKPDTQAQSAPAAQKVAESAPPAAEAPAVSDEAQIETEGAAPETQPAVETEETAKPAPTAEKTAEGESDKPVFSADFGDGQGVLEILPDGYGFLRAENCLPGPNDVYLSQTQIRRFNLRNGDYITGKTRPQREGDRYEGMIYVSTVNGSSADAARHRPRFEDLTPIFPDSRLRLENAYGNTDLALRTIDLIAPIGKGQRGLIVSPPKAGKTVLLKMIANAITANYPEVQLMVLLIDERPEEVTDMQRSTHGEVLYSTFDEAPENHTRLSEMVLDKAQRQVEMGKDVVILLDSITRLARAYNLVIPPTGRSLSGGLDPGALLKPKKFFGSARNIEFGGSLTIIATALVDTGSRLDDIIYEEFKGTGNMELHLDRKLSERRIFPAIDINRSGTRRDELLYTPAEAAGALQIRRVLAGGSTQDATEQLMLLMEKTQNNEQLVTRIKGWIAALNK